MSGARGPGTRQRRVKSRSSSKLNGSPGGAAGGLGRRGRRGSRSSPVRGPPPARGVSSKSRKPNAPPPTALSPGQRDAPGIGAYGLGRGVTRTSGSTVGGMNVMTGGGKRGVLSPKHASSSASVSARSHGSGTGIGGGFGFGGRRGGTGDGGAIGGGTDHGGIGGAGTYGTGHHGTPGIPPGTTTGGSW